MPRMCLVASTTLPVPASPFDRIMAAPSAMRRSASPRLVAPHTNGTVNSHLSTRCVPLAAEAPAVRAEPAEPALTPAGPAVATGRAELSELATDTENLTRSLPHR